MYQRCRAWPTTRQRRSRSSVGKFLGEIAWRDFYFQVLYHFPEVLDDGYNPVMRGLPWQCGRTTPDAFRPLVRGHARVFPSWTPGCASFPPRASCTTACA